MQHQNHHKHMIEDFKKRFYISAVLTIPVLILSPLIQDFLTFLQPLSFQGDKYILFILSSVIFFYGGWPFLTGLISELKKKTPGMMTLIAVAITVAYAYSTAVTFGLEGKFFFWELATLIDIMLVGHWIEMRSVMQSSRALEELAKLMPTQAHLIEKDGSIKDIPLEEIKKGDIVLVKPGEKIPADGTVLSGLSYVNESMLTGESKPIEKKKGGIVIGGSINGEGSLEIEIQKTGDESFLSQVIELVREAQESKSKTQDLANKAALYLTIIAISGGLITLVVWLLLGKDLAFALERTVTVMVITCPHALGLAVPLVVAVSSTISAKKGILIRNRVAFEKAKDIQAIIFDKTGTLTKGDFGVTDVISLNKQINEKELLKYAASLETNSEHSIARGITQESETTFPVKEFNSMPGEGVEGVINGKRVKVVSQNYLNENRIQYSNKRIDSLIEQGKTVVFVLIENKLRGAIALADQIRPESKEAISQLKSMGIKCIMLTGDNKKVAQWVSEELDLDSYFAEVLPHQKAEKIKEVQNEGLIVAMVGDGVNDAPSLAQSDVGIAIGAGTDVAVEAADIILVRNNPLDILSIISLSQKTYGKMVQNLIWATGYNAIAIPIAAGALYSFGILLSPAVGAILMSLSTVIVAINARLLKD
ncbi:MAG: Copper-translocating P-type ATPase [candidate division WS6 bacterium 34_10]|uniref:Copper-translocating P-type ATPase n=1 Tax=candidate division WS6 bacterium 34_10 TaxID=1641389 RepID=A0A101HJ10_9BACT|nr:MAG: Copper-translocating P-type ATPase [candidate division WS6 bacterium 34_10]